MWSVSAQEMLWMSTMTAPMLRMFLMAATTGEVAYMPAKASVAQAEPRQWLQKPAAVASSRSTVLNTGRALPAREGMKVS